ncbi:TPA: hypothetical protein ACIAFK_005632, partial [Escherichia coli]
LSVLSVESPALHRLNGPFVCVAGFQCIQEAVAPYTDISPGGVFREGRGPCSRRQSRRNEPEGGRGQWRVPCVRAAGQ